MVKEKRKMTPEWPRIRKEIIERDGKRCRKCGRSTDLQVHHIIPVYLGGPDDPSNLCTLCAACHLEWEAWESGMTTPFDKWLSVPPFSMLYAMYKVAAQTPDKPSGELRAEVDEAHANYLSGTVER